MARFLAEAHRIVAAARAAALGGGGGTFGVAVGRSSGGFVIPNRSLSHVRRERSTVRCWSRAASSAADSRRGPRA